MINLFVFIHFNIIFLKLLQFHVTFSGNPEIIHITPDLEKAQGSEVQLTCVAMGIPPPIVSWVDEVLEPVTQISLDLEYPEYPEIVGPTETLTHSVSGVSVVVENVETR